MPGGRNPCIHGAVAAAVSIFTCGSHHAIFSPKNHLVSTRKSCTLPYDIQLSTRRQEPRSIQHSSQPSQDRGKLHMSSCRIELAKAQAFKVSQTEIFLFPPGVFLCGLPADLLHLACTRLKDGTSLIVVNCVKDVDAVVWAAHTRCRGTQGPQQHGKPQPEPIGVRSSPVGRVPKCPKKLNPHEG